MRADKRALWLGKRRVVAAAPGPVQPNTLIGIVNGYSIGSFWSFTDQTKNFSDAGTTQITASGLIYQTNDLCSRANHLQMATSGHRPTWGASGATFAGGAAGAGGGSAMRSVTAGTSSTVKTIGVACTPTGLGTITGQQVGNNAGFFNLLSGGIVELYSGASLQTASGTISFGTSYTIIAVCNGASSKIYVNGSLIASGSMGGIAWSMLTLGNDGTGGFTSPFFAGLMKGAFWVEGNFTAPQIASAHTDLMAM